MNNKGILHLEDFKLFISQRDIGKKTDGKVYLLAECFQMKLEEQKIEVINNFFFK